MTSKERRKVLLLTSADLSGGSDIGAIFVRHAIAAVPEVDVEHIEERPFLFGPTKGRFKFLLRLWRSTIVKLGWLQALRLYVYRKGFLDKRAARVAAMSSKKGAECIWITASSPEIIAISLKLLSDGYDVRPMVLDAPEYLTENLRLPSKQKELVLHEFSQMMNSVRSAAVISMVMQRDYRDRFGVHAEIIRHGIHAARPAAPERPHPEIRIVFAGSLYSKTEWNAFVRALGSVRWKVANRDVRLFFIGDFPLAGADCPPEVVKLGSLSFDDALKKTSEMDIGYLPCWFSKEYELVSKTSFPGKMSSYTAAGLAIFHHAPAYTEVTEFLAKYRYGISCATLMQAGILQHLEELVALVGTDSFTTARQNAFSSEFSAEVTAARTRRFLFREERIR